MNLLSVLVCAIVGLATTLALIPVIQRARARAVAAALGGIFHHTHKTPVSRLGGLALAAAFAVVALVGFIFFAPDGLSVRENAVIILGALSMFGLGFWDDLRRLGARKKLAGQILIALAVCCCGI